MEKIKKIFSGSNKIISIFLILFIIALSSVLISYSSALGLSDSYMEGYNCETIRMETFDGYSYDMFHITTDEIEESEAGTVPFIFVIHGLGSVKEEQLDTALSFVKNGYAVFVPDIRGQGSGTGPFSFGVDDVQDISDLLTFIQDDNTNSWSYLNKSNVGIWGHSMGGFLSILTALKDSRIKTCVEGSGPTNLSQVLLDEQMRLNLIGSPVDLDDEDAIYERTVLNYLSDNPNAPDNLFVAHGTADTSVPYIHSVMLNQSLSVSRAANASFIPNYKFKTYQDSNHGLSTPYLAEERTCWEDFIMESVSWFDLYLKFKVTDYETVSLFSSPIKDEMKDSYKVVYLLHIVSLIPLLFLIHNLLWKILPIDERKSKMEKEDNSEKDNAKVISNGEEDNTGISENNEFGLKRELIFVVVYLLAFLLSGVLFKNWFYPTILKIIVAPFFLIIPVLIFKVYQERKSKYISELGITRNKTIVSLIASAITFIYFILVYNLLFKKVYANIVIVRFVLTGTTSVVLPILFWTVLPGVLMMILGDVLYFRNLYEIILDKIKNIRVNEILKNPLAMSLILGIFVGICHAFGLILFNLFIPDFDLRAFDIPIMLHTLFAIIGFGLVFVVTFLMTFLTKFTKNSIGSAFLITLILGFLYVNNMPRVF